jgi:hypothetical protein
MTLPNFSGQDAYKLGKLILQITMKSIAYLSYGDIEDASRRRNGEQELFE